MTNHINGVVLHPGGSPHGSLSNKTGIRPETSSIWGSAELVTKELRLTYGIPGRHQTNGDSSSPKFSRHDTKFSSPDIDDRYRNNARRRRWCCRKDKKQEGRKLRRKGSWPHRRVLYAHKVFQENITFAHCLLHPYLRHERPIICRQSRAKITNLSADLRTWEEEEEAYLLKSTKS